VHFLIGISIPERSENRNRTGTEYEVLRPPHAHTGAYDDIGRFPAFHAVSVGTRLSSHVEDDLIRCLVCLGTMQQLLLAGLSARQCQKYSEELEAEADHPAMFCCWTCPASPHATLFGKGKLWLVRALGIPFESTRTERTLELLEVSPYFVCMHIERVDIISAERLQQASQNSGLLLVKRRHCCAGPTFGLPASSAEVRVDGRSCLASGMGCPNSPLELGLNNLGGRSQPEQPLDNLQLNR
jgi:hypothetical protein